MNRPHPRRLALAAGLTVGAASLIGPGTAGATTPVTASAVYTTPGLYQFTVPLGVTSLGITAVGAPGGAFSIVTGGRGASETATVPVTPGTILTVGVGGPGGSVTPATLGTPGAGGINGGGPGGGGAAAGAGGGGASSVSVGDFYGALVVAAGGGGANEGEFGGDAGSPGTGGSVSGGAGTLMGGGAAGADVAGSGTPGSFGFGGWGAGGGAFNGGGGGGGYYGGGGGGSAFINGSGAGGGGASYVIPSASAVSGPTLTSSPPSVTISYAAPTAEFSTPSLSFATQSQGTTSPEQGASVSNNGSAPLVISGIQLAGANVGDYLIDDGCQEPVAPGASCRIGVRFDPQAEGASTATLTLASNAASTPAALVLSGSGGPLPAGPQGAPGAQGPAGPPGHTGPAANVVCRSGQLAAALCAIEFAPGTFKIPAAKLQAAFTVLRSGHAVVHGTITIRRGHVVEHAVGRLRRGRYTLVIATMQRRHTQVLLRRQFTVH